MKQLLALLALCACLTGTQARAVPDPALRLADRLVTASWRAPERDAAIPIDALRTLLQSAGATPIASVVLCDELRAGLTRDRLVDLVAGLLAVRFSASELAQIDATQGPGADSRLLQFDIELTQGPAFAQRILKASCVAAYAVLGAVDRNSLAGACGSFF